MGMGTWRGWEGLAAANGEGEQALEGQGSRWVPGGYSGARWLGRAPACAAREGGSVRNSRPMADVGEKKSKIPTAVSEIDHYILAFDDHLGRCGKEKWDSAALYGR